MNKFMGKNSGIIKYILRISGILVLSLFVLFLLINLVQFGNIFFSYTRVNKNISEIKTSIDNRDIDSIISDSKSLNKNLKTLKYSISNIKLFNQLPIIGNNITAIYDLTDIGISSTNIIIDLEPIKNENSDLVKAYKSGLLDFSDIRIRERILKIIADNQDIFDNLEKNINNIFTLSKKNKDAKFLISKVKSTWNIIDKNYEKIELVKEYLPIIKNAPKLLGYGKTSRYLLLLQNNTELRPTGGFIGTYGILDIKNGDILNLSTDNIYNLDRASTNRLKIEPPKALKDYLGITYLFLRDSNFDPDYKVSAKVAESFYKRESLDTNNISGVIAITPEVLRSLIEYFGDITVMGETYTAENVVELLNYETKYGFWDKDIKESDRKIIIQKISDLLFEKVKGLSLNGYKDLYAVLVKNLEEKQLLLYFNNEDTQKLIENKEWAGLINQEENSDYVNVIDANLLSGKADSYVTRDIDYTVENNSKKTTSILSVKYNYYPNENSIYKDDAETTNFYRTYTRVYVPKGSWLISVKKDGEIINNDDIDFKIENNKTSFGIYITVPKNSTSTYTFEYQLTEKLSNKLSNSYSFIYQKQPGIIGNNINFNFNLDYIIKNYSINSESLNVVAIDNTLNINGYNKKDIKLNIEY